MKDWMLFHQYDGASTYSIVVKAESIFGCKADLNGSILINANTLGETLRHLWVPNFVMVKFHNLLHLQGVQFGNGIQRKVLLL